MLVDVQVDGIDLFQGVHGVDGYVESEGGLEGKSFQFPSPPPQLTCV